MIAPVLHTLSISLCYSLTGIDREVWVEERRTDRETQLVSAESWFLISTSTLPTRSLQGLGVKKMFGKQLLFGSYLTWSYEQGGLTAQQSLAQLIMLTTTFTELHCEQLRQQHRSNAANISTDIIDFQIQDFLVQTNSKKFNCSQVSYAKLP